ncbi:hypothetical protein CGGC5_v006429 [Colletotrichum fructicola Nara gc5]|uniref:Uncharacterized protein n=1 Tax=Colletotrichum fructicola (strain Nara gc5) TaxID=1213859 RepID=A0A7J6JAP8_COLFN|nr:hypothetical protein CGGC5_v006429 [Colletotrichum fructicola Nara gc5]
MVTVTTVYDSMTTKNDCDEAHDYDDDNDNEEALPLSLSLRNGVPQQFGSSAIHRSRDVPEPPPAAFGKPEDHSHFRRRYTTPLIPAPYP